MTLLNDLLERGYLPRELPPSFTTSDFANLIAHTLGSMPAGFRQDKRVAEMGTFNLARFGSLRRALGIPNPIMHFNLCQIVGQHWTDLEALTRQSTLSLTRPRRASGEPRALEREVDHTRLPLHRAKARVGGRYVVRADISRFYPSIYTHSIPWAVHGKPLAKSNRTTALYGNVLDTWVRNAQSGQTHGIPIGPDTSLLFAEVLLAAVDKELLQRTGPIKGFRYMDDYELVFPTLATAESAVTALEESLAEFELALNPAKTRFVELPHELERPWSLALRSIRLGTKKRGPRQNLLVRYFGKAFELLKLFPNEPVVNFAISRLVGLRFARADWALIESLLLQCLMVESGTTRYILELLLRHEQWGLDRKGIENVLNLQVERHAPLGQTSEVAWAIWGCMAGRPAEPGSTPRWNLRAELERPSAR